MDCRRYNVTVGVKCDYGLEVATTILKSAVEEFSQRSVQALERVVGQSQKYLLPDQPAK